jgi:hypothetical protein
VISITIVSLLSGVENDARVPDQLASAYERLPMPDARDRYDELGVAPFNGRLTIFHVLSAQPSEIDIELPRSPITRIT